MHNEVHIKLLAYTFVVQHWVISTIKIQQIAKVSQQASWTMENNIMFEPRGRACWVRIIRFICGKSIVVFHCSACMPFAVEANDMHRRVLPTKGTKSSFYVHTTEWAGEPLIPLRIESANCWGLNSLNAKCIFICICDLFSLHKVYAQRSQVAKPNETLR